jgi:hypothetical protein
MKPERTIGLVVGLIVLIGSHGAALGQGPPPVPYEEQPEVLTRGPVHEAFAEPVNLEIQDGLVAPIAPPPNIQEIPPDERPRGDQFAWVPGYWSWDGDRDAYIWVSACWRAAPPNMYWVPGYWSPITETRRRPRGSGWQVVVEGVVNVHVGGGQETSTEVVGWEWVAGFWTQADVEEIEYLPAPPAPLDIEPPGPPLAGRIWVPGCWYWRDGGYVRRSGYWMQPQADWVWVPSHYKWTPRGYVFCQGHWDYALENRGVLFAPVHFPQSVYRRSGFTYSPSIAIDVDVLRVNLFVYPRYSHYFFGDYYDDDYVRVGIYPRLGNDRKHTYYDPIYQQNRWRNQRTEPRWEERQRQEYDRLRADRDQRPARTYREQETRLAKMPAPKRRAQRVARPLATVVNSRERETPLSFERIEPDARQEITRQVGRMQEFRENRSRWEAGAEDEPNAVGPAAEAQPRVQPKSPREVRATRPERVKIQRPPMAGKRTGSRKDELAPPPKPEEERRSERDARGKGRGSDQDKERGNEPDKDKDEGKDRDKDNDRK